MDSLICVGKILKAHGIKGAVKVQSFTEPADALKTYFPLTDKTGSDKFSLRSFCSLGGDVFLISCDELKTRNDAESVADMDLYTDKNRFKSPDKDEFYHYDLIGLKAETSAGQSVGKVLTVLNYGAGDILEIGESSKTSFMIPFSNSYVPEIDIENKRIVVCPPSFAEEKEIK